MINLTGTKLLLSALVSASLLASPMVLADHHGGERGKHDTKTLCEKLEKNDGKWDHEKHQAKLQKRFDTMAERLELTAEQRETWDQIQAEMKAKRAEKMEQWKARMAERCAEGAE